MPSVVSIGAIEMPKLPSRSTRPSSITKMRTTFCTTPVTGDARPGFVGTAATSKRTMSSANQMVTEMIITAAITSLMSC